MILPVFDDANAADVRQLFRAPALQSSEHSRWDGCPSSRAAARLPFAG